MSKPSKPQQLSSKSTNKNTKNIQPSLSVSSNSAQLFVPVIITLIVALHFVLLLNKSTDAASYNFIYRLWGFDNIAYMSMPIQLLFYVSTLALTWGIYFGYQKIKSFFTAYAEKKVPFLIHVLIGTSCMLLSSFVFYTYRIKYFFLGDMRLRVDQTLKGEIYKTEYLTMKTLAFLHAKLKLKYADITMDEVFIYTGLAAGVLFIGLAYLSVNILYKNNVNKLLSFLFLVSGAYVLMFFGYLEIYALPAFSIMLFLTVSALVMKGKLHFIFSLAAFALAVGFHGFSLIFLPSVLYLIYKNTPLQKLPLGKIPPYAYLLAGFVSIGLLYYIGPLFDFNFFLPFKDDLSNKKMLVFSSKHIWEYLNATILGGGGALIICAFLVIPILFKKDNKSSIAHFLILASFFAVGFTFILDAMRGSGDWDLYALPFIAANLFVPYYLLESQTFLSKRNSYILLVAGLTFSVFNTGSWISINHTDKSIAKIKSMLIHDPGSYYAISFQSEPGLALSFKDNKLMEEAEKMHQITFSKYGLTCGKCVYNYASFMKLMGKEDKTTEILEYILLNFPYYPHSYTALLDHYSKAQDNLNFFRVAAQLYNNYSAGNNDLGKYIKSDVLIQVFENLVNWEAYQGNNAKAFEVQNVINRLKAGG